VIKHHPEEVALFFKTTTGLDKVKIGEYIGEKYVLVGEERDKEEKRKWGRESGEEKWGSGSGVVEVSGEEKVRKRKWGREMGKRKWGRESGEEIREEEKEGKEGEERVILNI
jgi:hypothetical protein